MATIATFKSYAKGSDYVRGVWKTGPDRHKLSDDELKEILSYNDIRKEFEYYNWYGTHYPVVAIVEKIELKDNYLVYTVTTNRDIPKHYIPTPFQILEGKDLLFPVSVSRE